MAMRGIGAGWLTRLATLVPVRVQPAAVAVLLFGIALALGFYQIGHKSVWYDEAVSIGYARAPLDVAWAKVTGQDSNGALYYALLWGWVHVFGFGEGATRALSAIFGAGVVAAVFLVGRHLFSAWIGAGGALLLAVQGFFLQYAQEARSYTLAMLLASLATYFLLRGVDGSRRTWWIAYTLTLAAGVYAHLFVGFVGVAHVGWVMWSHRVHWKVALVSAGSAAILSAPLVAALLLRPGPQWQALLSGESVRYVITEMTSGAWPVADIFEGMVVLGVVLAVNRRDHRMGLLLAWLLVPIAVMLAISSVRPFITPRYVLVSLPALALLTSAAALSVGRRQLRAGLYGVLFGISLFGMLTWYTADRKHDWRSATQLVGNLSGPDDGLIVFPGYEHVALRYYVDRLGLSVPAPNALDAGQADTVWLVVHETPGIDDPRLPALISELERTHVRVGEPHAFDYIRVTEWRLTALMPPA